MNGFLKGGIQRSDIPTLTDPSSDHGQHVSIVDVAIEFFEVNED